MLKNDFAKNMKKRREFLGLNGSELGNLAGVGKSTISYIERGVEKTNPTLDRVESIAKGLKMPAWVLLLPPDSFRPDNEQDIVELYNKLSMLTGSNAEKVSNYIDDMLTLQKSSDI